MQTDWYAESLRITAFVTPQWTQRRLFLEIADAPAAAVVEHPQLQVLQETGNAFGAHLAVSQQPSRVDVVLSDTPVTGLATQPKPFFWIGKLADRTSDFDKLIIRTSTLVKSASRLAVAIAVVQPVNSAIDGTQLLKEYLPTINYDPKTDIDLVYQINRPRIGAKGDRINRLARWEVIQSQTKYIDLMAGAILPDLRSGLAFAARIYVDISTDAENATPLDDIPERVQELRSMALQLIEQGG